MKTLKQISIICLFCLCAFQLSAYTEKNMLQNAADLSQVKSALIMNQEWIPYPAYSDRAGWDNFLGDTKEDFIKQGEKQLDYEWKVVKATDYIEYERSGDRNIMQNPYGSNNRAIADLFMAELAEGKGRFIDQLINGVFHSCEMTSWVLSAHLGSAQVSHHSLPDNKKHVIDLTSGDLSSLLSWIYYYLHPEFNKVNPVISDRLRTELQERTLDTYMNDSSFWWMAFDYKPGMMVNNWNPWCNFNVLQSFFLLENDKDKLANAVYRTMVSVDKFINYTHEDGACEEGPSYWGHAAGKMYDYLQMLYNGTGGKISIFNEPMIKAMGEYIARSYVGNGWVVNFADASAKGGGDAAVIYRYGKAVNSEVMMQYAAYLNSLSKERVSAGLDVFRTLQTLLYRHDMGKVSPVYKSPAYTWYPETEFCYMTNKNGFFLATKGGYNNESHNHNDAGTFSLYLNTTPIFIDAGVGTYTRQTFSSERYTIWTMQSDYHNLPKINNVSQEFGSKYKATEVKFNPKQMHFSANIATAYPPEASVKRWIRSYTLNNNSLKIQDNFTLDGAASQFNQINFMTWGEVDITKPGEIIIEVKGEKVKLSYDKNVFTPYLESIKLDDPRLSNVWGKEIYRVSLNAQKIAISGTYTYTIQPIK